MEKLLRNVQLAVLETEALQVDKWPFVLLVGGVGLVVGCVGVFLLRQASQKTE